MSDISIGNEIMQYVRGLNKKSIEFLENMTDLRLHEVHRQAANNIQRTWWKLGHAKVELKRKKEEYLRIRNNLKSLEKEVKDKPHLKTLRTRLERLRKTEKREKNNIKKKYDKVDDIQQLFREDVDARSLIKKEMLSRGIRPQKRSLK